MGIFHFLIVVQGIIAAMLVGVILMQRSEGGGLGTGGSPSGLMSARGAADFMTRTTTALATMFILLSISLAFVASKQSGGSKIDETFKRTQTPAAVIPAAPNPEAAVPAAGATTSPVLPAKPKTSEVPLDK